MKLSLSLPSFVLLAFSFGSADDSQKTGGKTLSEPVEFLSPKAYDEEAKLRIANFTLPEDVRASLFADSSQTQNPSAICFDDKGRLYIAEIHRWRAGVQDIRHEQQILLEDIKVQNNRDRYAMYEADQTTRPLSFYTEFTDRIVRVEDTDGNGRADTSTVWANGFNDVLDGPGIGLVAGPEGEIYYTNIPHLWRLRDTTGDGVADERTSLQDGFGVRMSISGHDMHGIIWGPDGKLYWTIGDRGYSLTTREGRHYHRPFTGGVFRCDPDGSNLEEIYSGLRNPQELAFDEFGNLFTCDNDADAWDTGRLVYILEGGDSGWNHGHQVLLNFRNQLELRTPDYAHPGHNEIPMNPWMTEALWEPHHEGRPAFALPPIEKVSWGPSGLVYNYGVTAMPERYARHFWVCNFGGAKGDLEAFSLKSDGAGFALDHHEVFMVGLGNTDVEFGPDGRMYLSCFNNSGWFKQDLGNIYALHSPEALDSDLLKSTSGILVADFSAFDEPKLDELLGHPDMRVRQRAQFELARRSAHPVFARAVAQTENRLKRVHGVWGLGQISRSDSSLLEIPIGLLSDGDPEIRAQAARVLSDSRTSEAGEALASALADESPRVKAFAAIGVGKCGNVPALPRLLEILAENDDRDVFLRHACVQGIWYLNEREKILKEVHNESAAVRLGVLLALRKLLDPRVKYFLSDGEEAIRYEAIRAISDLDLVTALPDLAREIDRYADPSDEIRPPQGHRDWIIHTRLINANFRVGQEGNAASLLKYAANAALPQMLREQTLLAVLEWPNPGPVDPTNGNYRPLDPETRTDISDTVRKDLPGVFETADGGLLGLATRIALAYGVEAPVDLLIKQIVDPEMDTDSRVSSLDGLARQDPAALAPLWDDLLEEKEARFRSAAVSNLMRIEPSRGLREAFAMARSYELAFRQQGYRLLSNSRAPKVSAFFQERLSTIETEMPGALLDLLESAEEIPGDEIAGLLASHRESVDPNDLMAVFRPSLEGGDAESGREIFLTHAVGQCAKCHKVDGDGGIAGPDLTGIGSLHDNRYLLESLIAPSNIVVPGYGITLVTLKNGESLGGMLMSENESEIVLNLPDPEAPHAPAKRTIPMSEVESRHPPISAMPPMAYLMTKSEIRDLVAYLASLKEKKGDRGH